MLDPQVEEIDRNFLVVEVALAVVEVAAVVDVSSVLSETAENRLVLGCGEKY